VEFDGLTVTVARPLNPFPRRRIQRFPLAGVIRAELIWLGGEGERRLFGLHVRGFPRSAVWVSVWIGPKYRRTSPWEVLATTINEAVAERMRCVLGSTIGPAPWDQAQWTRAEALAPDLWVFDKRDQLRRGSVYSKWVITGHREVIESEVLLPLWRNADVPFDSPYPPPALPRHPAHLETPWKGTLGYSDRTRAEHSDRTSWEDGSGYAYRGNTEERMAGVWHGLIDSLQDGHEITTGAEWGTKASSLLAWGHHRRGKQR
jgi:hypothetical protein